MINLGNKVKHMINGFEGIAAARTDFLHGCAQIMVEPTKLHEGKPLTAECIDEQNLESIEAAKPFIYPAETIKLGSKVRDTWTGFSGILSGRTVYLHRSARMIISPTVLNDGKIIDSFYFDEERVELVAADKPKVSAESSAWSGGPQRYPSNR